MARVLIVGCGCRGRELAAALKAEGHAVRGTSRDECSREAIEATGAEAAVADPGRLSTLVPHLRGITVLCWLMGTAVGEAEEIAALHGARLESLLDAIVDTPVRGLVYEGAGTVEPGLLERGATLARRASEGHRMPVEVLDTDPARPGEWLAAATAAAERVLSA